jgi:SAM-dependent methyltransferase
MTFLGRTYRGKRLNITACDPLADEYADMARRHGIARPVETVRPDAERLTERFAQDSFNLVHASNSLDHAYDPFRAIEQMLAVTKPGGSVILRHFPNEAVKENYQGLHQWNFEDRDGRAVLWNHSAEHDLTEHFGAVSHQDERWVVVKMRRPLADRNRDRTANQ